MSTGHNNDQVESAASLPDLGNESADGMGRRLLLGAGLAGLAGIASLTRTAKAGPLNPPPGPIASTGKTVQEIYDKVARTDFGIAEPRIPVQSLPGSATAQYVISQPGSYYLTGNIQGVAGKNGIEITASDVTLDLYGFSMIGVASALTAVRASTNTLRITMQNGRIAGWNASVDRGGVDLTNAEGALCENLVVSNTVGGAGISTGPRGIIRSCIGIGNASAAFFLRPAASVLDCTSIGNGALDPGILGGVFSFFGGCSVERLTSIGDKVGIRIEDTGTITSCRIVNAQGWAIRVGGRVIIRQNEILSCENGIECNSQSVIADNCIAGCNGSAISLAASTERTEVFGNRISHSSSGIVLGTASVRNLLRSNSVQVFGSTAYSIPAGNSFGPIVNVAGVGVITSVANANHPWANFIY